MIIIQPANPEDKDKRKVSTRIWTTTSADSNFIHIAVRNTNVNNIPTFATMEKILDFDLWHSTKRDQHRMTAGSLGDALKRCLGMGYALWTEKDNPDINETLEDKQWNEPIIIRCNGTERKAFLRVYMSKGKRWVDVEQLLRPTRDIGDDTEVEVTLPMDILKTVPESESLESIFRYYYKIYKIGRRRTQFDLRTSFSARGR